MKLSRIIIALGILSLLAFSCKKNAATPPSAIASLNIVNANTGSQGLLPNFGAPGFSYAQNAQVISYASAENFGIIPNDIIMIAEGADTAQPFFTSVLGMKTGGIYSLFIAGTTATPDTMFVQDMIPAIPIGDSSTGLRFLNLGQWTNSISIDIAGTPGNTVSNLGYKMVTPFQFESANSAAQSIGYTFEFRDAVSDSLLISYPLTIVLNHSQTLVFCGSTAAGLSVFAENNY